MSTGGRTRVAGLSAVGCLLALAGCGVVAPAPSVSPPAETVSPRASASSVPPAPPPPTAADPALSQALAGLLASPALTGTGDVTSALVSDGTTGVPIYALNADRAVAPASTLKAITAMAALDILGPDYRFHTTVAAGGAPTGGVLSGDLVLRGGGDPTLLESDLTDLAAQVKAMGVTRVTGRLLVDAGCFDSVRYHPDWDASRDANVSRPQIAGLTASVDGLGSNGTVRHVGALVVGYSPGGVGEPATVTLTPAAASGYVTVVNKTTTSASGSDRITVARTPGTNTITLTGSIGAAQPHHTWPMSVDDPGLYAGHLFRAALARQGIVVGAPTNAPATPGTTVLASHDSAPLRDVVAAMLKQSNNGYAEHLTKTLGRIGDTPGTWESGTARVRSWVAGSGSPAAGVAIRDGSGFSLDDRLTARTLVQSLDRARGLGWFDDFYAGLPVAGNPDPLVGGTLADRMIGTSAAGNLRGKTGSLPGVSALAGYVTGADGRRYTFALLSNFAGDSPVALEDRLGVLLAGWRHP